MAAEPGINGEYIDALRRHRTPATVQSHRHTLQSIASFCRQRRSDSTEITIDDIVEYIISNPSDHTLPTLVGIIHTVSNYIAYTQDDDPDRVCCIILAAVKSRQAEWESSVWFCE